jgi:hypothetical protein
MIRKFTTKMLALLIASALALPKVVTPQAILVLDAEFSFFEHEDFQGESTKVSQQLLFSTYPHPHAYKCKNIFEFNDKATSAKWAPKNNFDEGVVKAEVCFWSDADCSGTARCYEFRSRKEANFAQWGFNDVISSFSVQTKILYTD